jgi:bifunctional DNA-binding transcriptional regulator/antitoxin component of YhaV-PrlF toxin-antitoxin module
METTRLSTKGQVVIPEPIRRDIEVGTAFAVTRRRNLIILKRLSGLTLKEQRELKELEKIWRDIDEGRCQRYTVEEFFAKMREW